NEPARCAVLLPLLARLPQPLALLEVGASAGLCLLPDRYGYDYGTARLEPPTNETCSPPVFECHASGAVPIPGALPTIAWRAGIDLNPIDVNATAETAWLETLVWPGQEERVHRLRAALAVAQAEPPRIVKGNLLTDLAALMAEAPECATLVVFHTAVLAYVASKVDREQFAKAMRRSRAVWISNEVPSVFPDIAKAAPPTSQRGRFLLAIDGSAVAWTDPHGESIGWFGASCRLPQDRAGTVSGRSSRRAKRPKSADVGSNRPLDGADTPARAERVITQCVGGLPGSASSPSSACRPSPLRRRTSTPCSCLTPRRCW